MGIEATWQLDVANGEEIKLLQTAAASGVDSQQDGPGQAAPGQAYDGQDFEEAEKQKAIERAVVEDVVIVDGKERLDPIEPAVREPGSRVPALQRIISTR